MHQRQQRTQQHREHSGHQQNVVAEQQRLARPERIIYPRADFIATHGEQQ